MQKSIQTKQKMCLLKMNLKNYRHLIQSISTDKVIWKWWYPRLFTVSANTKTFKKGFLYSYFHILSWKSKRLFDEIIKPRSTSTNILNPLLNYVGTNWRVEFKEICLKQDKILFNHGKIVNIYIAYEINKNFSISSYPTPENCLFGAVKLTKPTDIDWYKCSGYSIGFDRKEFFSIGDDFDKNVINFGVDMSSS